MPTRRASVWERPASKSPMWHWRWPLPTCSFACSLSLSLPHWNSLYTSYIYIFLVLCGSFLALSATLVTIYTQQQHTAWVHYVATHIFIRTISLSWWTLAHRTWYRAPASLGARRCGQGPVSNTIAHTQKSRLNTHREQSRERECSLVRKLSSVFSLLLSWTLYIILGFGHGTPPPPPPPSSLRQFQRKFYSLLRRFYNIFNTYIINSGRANKVPCYTPHCCKVKM